MGPKGGGVPGEDFCPDLPYKPTTVNDHTGKSERPDVTCTPLPGVDTTCVEKELELGRETGP